MKKMKTFVLTLAVILFTGNLSWADGIGYIDYQRVVESTPFARDAMKAIDARNQQPNNVNIMALDSRSFAEYLNDNADILTAVLAKQGALGRRS